MDTWISWIHGYLDTWISVFFGYMDTWILWISIFFIIHILDILSKYPDIFGYFFKPPNVEKDNQIQVLRKNFQSGALFVRLTSLKMIPDILYIRFLDKIIFLCPFQKTVTEALIKKTKWLFTLISLITVEVGIKVEGRQKLPNH